MSRSIRRGITRSLHINRNFLREQSRGARFDRSAVDTWKEKRTGTPKTPRANVSKKKKVQPRPSSHRCVPLSPSRRGAASFGIVRRRCKCRNSSSSSSSNAHPATPRLSLARPLAQPAAAALPVRLARASAAAAAVLGHALPPARPVHVVVAPRHPPIAEAVVVELLQVAVFLEAVGLAPAEVEPGRYR